jgi:uncharacterized protein (DUF305 family)
MRFPALIALIIAVPTLVWAGPSSHPSTADYIAGMHIMHRDMNIRYSGQTDTDFVRGMIPHHQGAVDMANVVQAYGRDSDIRALARWIRVSQETEIAFMRQWLHRRGEAEPAAESAATQQSEGVNEFKTAMERMHIRMNIAYSGDAEADFVCAMIPHHQGAIDMAATQLRHGQDPQILALARDIISSQQSDIARMRYWLRSKGLTCTLANCASSHPH